MSSIRALYAALGSAALSLGLAPTLALAQQATQPGSAPSPAGGAAPGAQGGSGWLWIIAAIVVLALVWWAMTSRRRHTMARTRM